MMFILPKKTEEKACEGRHEHTRDPVRGVWPYKVICHLNLTLKKFLYFLIVFGHQQGRQKERNRDKRWGRML